MGAGANARVPAAFWTLAVFFVYAAVIWLPMAAPCVRGRRIWPWLGVQALAFLTVFVLFWSFGAG